MATSDEALAAAAKADWRCRSGAAKARDFLSRALIAWEDGDAAAARRDLIAALEHDPTDVAINRVALRSGDDELSRDAAARIIAGDCDFAPALVEAIGVQLNAGVLAVARFDAVAGGAGGWIAWKDEDELSVELARAGETAKARLAPDPAHRLNHANFSVASFAYEDVERVGFLHLNRLLVEHRVPSAFPVDEDVALIGGAAADLTVIVPVYDGYEETRLCLETLLAQRAPGLRIVLVDDAARDAQLSQLLNEAARQPGVVLLRNAVNRGFAKAVNRALRWAPSGDVLLLNADVVLPPGAIARLRRLAGAGLRIGTVTPFSNNSQLTSFPRPHVVNPLPSYDEIVALNAAAARANGDQLIDIPTGIGFCLLITRAALDAVGLLPDVYGRGYYEDVEFCLQVRERGLRNVCAAGVFVGHAGSASFKSDKRALIARNARLLDLRFAGREEESAALVADDPLLGARGRIEEWAPPPRCDRLIVAEAGRVAWRARQRARQFEDEAPGGRVAMVMSVIAGERIELRRPGVGSPASLTFALDADGLARALAHLARRRPAAVEIVDGAALPDALIDGLIGLGAPVDLVLFDLTWLKGPTGVPAAGGCQAPALAGACPQCAQAFAADSGGERARRFERLLSAAREVIVLDSLAAPFAARVFGGGAAPLTPPRRRAPPRPGAGRLGVIAPFPTAQAGRLLMRLSRLMAGKPRVVVLGGALAADDMLAAESVWILGPLAADEYERAMARYGVGRLAALDRSGLFDELERLSAATGAAKAYFDWSFGALPPEPGDLALDPRLCDAKTASAIAFWAGSD